MRRTTDKEHSHSQSTSSPMGDGHRSPIPSNNSERQQRIKQGNTSDGISGGSLVKNMRTNIIHEKGEGKIEDAEQGEVPNPRFSGTGKVSWNLNGAHGRGKGRMGERHLRTLREEKNVKEGGGNTEAMITRKRGERIQPSPVIGSKGINDTVCARKRDRLEADVIDTSGVHLNQLGPMTSSRSRVQMPVKSI